MINLDHCRICLIQNVKMYKFDNILKVYYEELIDDMVNEHLSQWLCFECAFLLRKYHNFKQKCHKSLKILKELLEKGVIAINVIQIDREIIGLQSSLQLVSMTNNKVKTFRCKSSGQTKTFQNNYKESCGLVTEKLLTLHSNLSTIVNVQDQIAFDDDKLPYNGIDLENDQKEFNRDNITTEHCKNSNFGIDILKNKCIETNRFRKSVKKRFLNLNHWEKITLTEDNAEKEFQGKAISQKYLKAHFKCSECYRGFSREEMLKRHRKIKHCSSLGALECRFCHMRVKWKSRLQKHLKEHYTRYKCLRCELSFSVEESAFKHDEFHNGVTRGCPHCGEYFTHPSSFYTHLRKHRSKHVCSLCGTSFLSEFGLYMHKKVKHILSDIELSNTKKSKFCEVCEIHFDSREAYEEHLAQSATHNHTKGNGDGTPQPLKWRHTQRRAPRKYTKCSICGDNFSTYVAYTKHHLCKHPDIPITASLSKLNDKKICEICGASVAPASLASHINTHTREKRFTCNICGMQLSSKSGLNRHRLIHTGGKPNKCNICDKRFASTTNMRLHYRTVHAQEISNNKSAIIKKICGD